MAVFQNEDIQINIVLSRYDRIEMLTDAIKYGLEHQNIT